MRQDDTLAAYAGYHRRLAKRGYRIRSLSAFEEVPGLIEDLEKPYLTPKLAPDWHDFTHENCRWFVLYKGDQVAAALGSRFEQLGTETVRTYWPRITRRHYGGPKRIDQIKSVATPVADVLTGNLVYYGDLRMKTEFRGLSPIIRFFVRSCIISADLKWSPDWHYAMVSQKHFRAGAMYTYGFSRGIERVQEWYNAPSTRSSAEACIFMPRLEFGQMVRAHAAEMVSDNL